MLAEKLHFEFFQFHHHLLSTVKIIPKFTEKEGELQFRCRVKTKMSHVIQNLKPHRNKMCETTVLSQNHCVVFVGFLYPFMYLFSNTKCFQLSLNVSTFTLCVSVGKGWNLYPGARASRGEVLIRTQWGVLEGMLKFMPQGWKGEVSWAWSLSCWWLSGMDVVQLVLSQHLMEAGGEMETPGF